MATSSWLHLNRILSYDKPEGSTSQREPAFRDSTFLKRQTNALHDGILGDRMFILSRECSCSAAGQDAPVADREASSAKEGKDESSASPEDAMRSFMLAMLEGDEQELRKWSLPHKNLDVLLGGEQPPQQLLKQIKQTLETMPIERLRVGDKVELPGGRTMTVDKSRVNENRQLLQMERDPLPWTLVKKKGAWKVDPSPVIAARKAAAAARQGR